MILMICVEAVICIVSCILANYIVESGRVTTGKDSEEIKEKLVEVCVQLEEALREQSKEIGSYEVTAVVNEGMVTFISVDTERTSRIVQRNEGKTNYSMINKTFSKDVAIEILTIIVFFVLSVIASIIYFYI